MGANVFTIAAGAPFRETPGARHDRAGGSDPVAFPTSALSAHPPRRANFGEAFARVGGGALWLPEFRALGDATKMISCSTRRPTI